MRLRRRRPKRYLLTPSRLIEFQPYDHCERTVDLERPGAVVWCALPPGHAGDCILPLEVRTADTYAGRLYL